MTALFGIPLSLIGSAFGAITGMLSKRSAMNAEIVASERKHQLDAMVAVGTANSAAIDDQIRLLEAQMAFEQGVATVDPHRSSARRGIAYALVATVSMLIPALAVFGDIGWFDVVVQDVIHPGFLGIGRWTESVTQVIVANGLPLAWLEGVLTFVSTVVGFYFGTSAAQFKNPYTNKNK